jgi:hypothetical protein
MSYCSSSDIYAATKLSLSVVPTASVEAFIKAAEEYVDRLTFTTYHVKKKEGTVTDSSDNTLEDDTQTWTANEYADMYVFIYSGTGINQFRKILSNTEDTLTIEEDWDENPDITSKYRIIYTGTNPIVNEKIDGTGTDTLFVDNYPLIQVQSLKINDVSVTPSSLYLYNKMGQIRLSETSEQTSFYSWKPQQVEISYIYGVSPLSQLVKRMTIIQASLSTLAAQVGGTYATPSTYSLPEVSLTIGQAYVNIRETFNTLVKEAQTLEPLLQKYMIVA